MTDTECRKAFEAWYDNKWPTDKFSETRAVAFDVWKRAWAARSDLPDAQPVVDDIPCFLGRHDRDSDGVCIKCSHVDQPAPDAAKKALDAAITRLEDFADELKNKLWERKNRGANPKAVNNSADAKRLEETRREIAELKASLQPPPPSAGVEALEAVKNWYENQEDSAPVDSGCIECTAGTVPDRLNTGLCAFHKVFKVLP